jgi:aminoglycoside phosphotransferase (APT) family kinase protein
MTVAWDDETNHELARHLHDKAELGAVVAIEPASRSSNANFVVTDARGGRRVMRRYRRQPKPHTALIRLQRERWVLDVLSSVGAPVPQILASCEREDAEALLIEFADGEPLGSVLARRPRIAEAAWSAAGRALAKVHTIARAAAAAGCEQVGILAPEAPRGPYHYEQALANLDDLGRARPDLPKLPRLRQIVEQARPLYGRAPLVLCQYDTHLWQFMLADHGGTLECTILDWEHADLDDPDWDLAQLEIFRFEPVGPTAAAFFAAYGRSPSSPLYMLYRLERVAWLLAAHQRGETWLARSAQHAESFLQRLIDQPDRLARPVEAAADTLS